MPGEPRRAATHCSIRQRPVPDDASASHLGRQVCRSPRSETARSGFYRFSNTSRKWSSSSRSKHTLLALTPEVNASVNSRLVRYGEFEQLQLVGRAQREEGVQRALSSEPERVACEAGSVLFVEQPLHGGLSSATVSAVTSAGTGRELEHVNLLARPGPVAGASPRRSAGRAPTTGSGQIGYSGLSVVDLATTDRVECGIRPLGGR